MPPPLQVRSRHVLGHPACLEPGGWQVRSARVCYLGTGDRRARSHRSRESGLCPVTLKRRLCEQKHKGTPARAPAASREQSCSLRPKHARSFAVTEHTTTGRSGVKFPACDGSNGEVADAGAGAGPSVGLFVHLLSPPGGRWSSFPRVPKRLHAPAWSPHFAHRPLLTRLGLISSHLGPTPRRCPVNTVTAAMMDRPANGTEHGAQRKMRGTLTSHVEITLGNGPNATKTLPFQ